jgi:hypothetical protein
MCFHHLRQDDSWLPNGSKNCFWKLINTGFMANYSRYYPFHTVWFSGSLSWLAYKMLPPNKFHELVNVHSSLLISTTNVVDSWLSLHGRRHCRLAQTHPMNVRNIKLFLCNETIVLWPLEFGRDRIFHT